MKSKKTSLRAYILRVHLILLIAVSIMIGTVGIWLTLRDEARQRDLNLQNMAEAIAVSEPVKRANEENLIEDLQVYLDSLHDSLSDIDVISVVGSGNARLYHSNHDLIGTVYDGTMPSFSPDVKYYTMNENGPSGPQRRAYAAIYSSDGDLVGFVMTIMLMTSIRAKTAKMLISFILVFVIAIIIEIFISYKVSGKIRDKLMGYEPDTFTDMYLVRNKILESLREGVIAADVSGNIKYMNTAAVSMLSKAEDKTQAETSARKLLEVTVHGGKKEYSVPVNAGPETDIIMDRLPVIENGQHGGAIGILHNRTEYTKLAEDLAGTRYLVDSMRANNHDFTNKLHVIMGLLQMQMYDQAMHYIEDITIVQRETISSIMHAVDEPGVAALLIGKTSRASELNVKLVFRKDSHYSPEEYYVPEDALVTIIGNLIDNALDSMNVRPDESGQDPDAIREIDFGIYSSPKALLITVDDTGSGISEENLKHIFDNGFSTKGEGRGTGLYYIKNMIGALGGEITVESQEGEGTSFQVSFTKKD